MRLVSVRYEERISAPFGGKCISHLGSLNVDRCSKLPVYYLKIKAFLRLRFGGSLHLSQTNNMMLFSLKF